MLPNAYKDSDFTNLTASYATHAGVTPAEALIIDDYQDAHTMVLVAREDNKNEEAIKKVAAEFESTELQHLLVDKFKNEIVWP